MAEVDVTVAALVVPMATVLMMVAVVGIGKATVFVTVALDVPANPQPLSTVPLPSSLRTQASGPPAPKENVTPATMNPPSEVCRTENASSSPVPPYVFCHTMLPEESSFNNQASADPAPKEVVKPATMNPPSDVC